MLETEHNLKSFYNVGGVSAFILLAYSLLTIVIMFGVGQPPETAVESFTMLQENRLIGLLRLDILTIFAMPFYYLLLYGLYAALKNTHTAPITIATALGFAGVTLVLATPSVFSLLDLSDKFALAASEAEKNMFLAAGETILASDMWHGSGARVGGLLMQIGLFIISLLMLQSHAFRKATTWVGIATHGLDLLHILVGFIFPIGGIVLMMVAGPLYLVWFPLLGQDFFKLMKE